MYSSLHSDLSSMPSTQLFLPQVPDFSIYHFSRQKPESYIRFCAVPRTRSFTLYDMQCLCLFERGFVPRRFTASEGISSLEFKFPALTSILEARTTTVNFIILGILSLYPFSVLETPQLGPSSSWTESNRFPSYHAWCIAGLIREWMVYSVCSSRSHGKVSTDSTDGSSSLLQMLFP
jgi:hypothetical protein